MFNKVQKLSKLIFYQITYLSVYQSVVLFICYRTRTIVIKKLIIFMPCRIVEEDYLL
jgi:hypothetical protein